MLRFIRRFCFREVVVDTSAVDSTVLAVHLGDRPLQTLVYTASGARGTIGNRFTVRLTLCFSELGPFRARFVNVAANLEISLSGGSGRGVSLVFSVLVLLALEYNGIRRRLPGLESARRITDDFEMTSERGPNL